MISVGIIKGIVGVATSIGTHQIVGGIVKLTAPAASNVVVRTCVGATQLIATAYASDKLHTWTKKTIDNFVESDDKQKVVEDILTD